MAQGVGRRLEIVVAVWVAIAVYAVPAGAQPREVEGVSVRADLSVEDLSRRVSRDGWTMRHDGPWLYTNDQWTNAAGVTFFPANTEYWITVVVDECAECDFEVRFFDEQAGGYFPMTSILSRESDGSLVTVTGTFGVDRDMRGEIYLQMTDGGALYKTYLMLAQIR